MLRRFCIYGFLKNQRYFEPFLILAFVEKGLSFFEIGVLIAFRELVTNLLEIPSGAVADLLGRRRAMIVSFVAYVASFLVFGLGQAVWLLFPAMLLFSVGEAFRTGTHKAMIFQWLRSEGRTDERIAIYGQTRSWSKFGSAVSVLVGAAFVFTFDGYSEVFLLAAVPAALNVVNFLGYPAELDGEQKASIGPGQVWRHAKSAVVAAVQRGPVRRLLTESMGFEGVFHAAKDYLQPLLAAVAMTSLAGLAAATDWSEVQRTTLLIGPVYLVLHLTSGFASRRAYRVVTSMGGEERAAKLLWGIAALLFVGLLLGELAGWAAVSIAAFVLLHIAQNLWRPILVGRLDAVSDPAQGAVTLSVESQARRTATMILAPAFGWAIDATSTAGTRVFWPIGAVGLLVAVLMLASRSRPRA